MAEKMYFGVPGNIQEIPYPVSGMGFDTTADTEVTNLVSGGRSVYRAPTTFKTFNQTWRNTSANLKHLIDMYNGQFGPGPFYITDPTVSQQNVLPSRWSNAWQLAHQSGGWCRPVVATETAPLTMLNTVYRTNRKVTFTQAAAGSSAPVEGVVRTRLIRVPGKSYYIAASGTATGGAAIKVRAFNSTTNLWVLHDTFTTFTGVSTLTLSNANTTYTMLELDLYMPLGSTLVLRGIALGTEAATAGTWMPVGQGVGAVQFTNTAGGELVSSTIDRVGLSLDFTEVQNVESSML